MLDLHANHAIAAVLILAALTVAEILIRHARRARPTGGETPKATEKATATTATTQVATISVCTTDAGGSAGVR